jgi:hypothetical protein
VDVEAATYWLGWLKLAQLVAVFLVAVGVAAEFAGEWISRPLEKIIDDARELKIAQLTQDAAQLSAESESARAAIAAANARAESERLERVKLEAKIAPRRLSSAQKELIASSLSNVQKPPTIAVVSRLLDAEGRDFADDISAALEAAGWSTQRYLNWTMSNKGLFVATAEGTSVSLNDPSIDGLRRALMATNVNPEPLTIKTSEMATMSPHFQPNVLYLLVGAKP